MSDAIALSPRPKLAQYRKWAKDLVEACKAGDRHTIRAWAATWLDTLADLQGVTMTPQLRAQVDREADRIEARWRKLATADGGRSKCTLADTHFFIAREHGFESWSKFAEHLEGLARANSPVSQFESAADAIISGDVGTLERLLRQDPEVVRARSTRDHH